MSTIDENSTCDCLDPQQLFPPKIEIFERTLIGTRGQLGS
jgi:hypothetical protein